MIKLILLEQFKSDKKISLVEKTTTKRNKSISTFLVGDLQVKKSLKVIQKQSIILTSWKGYHYEKRLYQGIFTRRI